MTRNERLIEMCKSYAMSAESMSEATIYFELVEALKQPQIIHCKDCCSYDNKTNKCSCGYGLKLPSENNFCGFGADRLLENFNSGLE